MVIRWTLIAFLLTILWSCSDSKSSDSPNILFIAVDDLRPDLGCYGHNLVHSPYLDDLANTSSVFMRHYVQAPSCGPSRFCLLTGNRPVSEEYLSNLIAGQILPNQPESEKPETFIHHFRRNGYHTVGIGKISHSADGFLYGYEDEVSDQRELPFSWDELHFNSGKWGTGWNAFFGYADGQNRQSLEKQVAPYENEAVEDTGYVDGLTAQLAVEQLEELKKTSKPFFLGVGFFKPHLPFNAPKKFWDLYDRDSIDITSNPNIPVNVNRASLHGSGEFNQYKLGDEFPSLEKQMSDEYARKVRHAYYASISYVDAQIGKVLSKLEELELENNTIVVVWGDHGWHLGDQAVWGKHTLFENSLRSALLIRVPGAQKGKKVRSIVESVDIGPTLLDLCEIDYPFENDGASFKELLFADTECDNSVAYGYYRKGITMRSDRYRLTKYFRKEEPTIELYDHTNDPNESINLAQDNPAIVDSLMPYLQLGNTGIFQ